MVCCITDLRDLSLHVVYEQIDLRDPPTPSHSIKKSGFLGGPVYIVCKVHTCLKCVGGGELPVQHAKKTDMRARTLCG